MRLPLRSWLSTLTRLGLRWTNSCRVREAQGNAPKTRRRLSLESLDQRALLAGVIGGLDDQTTISGPVDVGSPVAGISAATSAPAGSSYQWSPYGFQSIPA